MSVSGQATASGIGKRSGKVVLIDDDPDMLHDETLLFAQYGFDVEIISEPVGLESRIENILKQCKHDNDIDQTVIFVDNRIKDFGKYFSIDHAGEDKKVVNIKDFRSNFGNTGQYVGTSICEWIVKRFSNEYAGFSIAVLSSFDDYGVKTRIKQLREKYPKFIGLLRKFSSSSFNQEERDAHKSDLERYLADVKEDNSTSESKYVGDEYDNQFPAGKLLKMIARKFRMSRVEIAKFLRLRPQAESKVENLLRSPGSFYLDNTSWYDRVKLCTDIMVVVKHDLVDDDAVARWATSANEICGGNSPKEVMVNGSIVDLIRLRSILKLGM